MGELFYFTREEAIAQVTVHNICVFEGLIWILFIIENQVFSQLTQCVNAYGVSHRSWFI